MNSKRSIFALCAFAAATALPLAALLEAQQPNPPAPPARSTLERTISSKTSRVWALPLQAVGLEP